jgi:hypothetical protein
MLEFRIIAELMNKLKIKNKNKKDKVLTNLTCFGLQETQLYCSSM